MKSKIIKLLISLSAITLLFSCTKPGEGSKDNQSALYSPMLEASKTQLDPLSSQIDLMLKNVNYALSRGLNGVSESVTKGKAIKKELQYNGYTIKGERILQSTSTLNTASYEVTLSKGKEFYTIISTETTDKKGNESFVGTYNNIIYTDKDSIPEKYFELLSTVKNAFSDPSVDQFFFVTYENRLFEFDNVKSAYSEINGTGSKIFSVKEELYTTKYDVVLSSDDSKVTIELEYTENLKNEVEPISLVIDSVLYNPYELKSVIESNLIDL